jgi:hypothetical protein
LAVHDLRQFYEKHGIDLDHLLSDTGREYCGRLLQHPFELFLTVNRITRRRIEAGSPETNQLWR